MTDAMSLASLGVFFIAAASPGPATLALATTSMVHGSRAGILFGLGLALGLSFWGIVAAMGLGAVLTQSASALLVLRLFGGAYLIYLAIRSLRSAFAAGNEAFAPSDQPAMRMFRRGLVLNLTNPKAVLAWTAVLALGLAPAASASALYVTTLACSLLGMAIYVAYALAFSQAPVRAAYRASRRAIDAVAGLLFGYAGIRLLSMR